MDVYKNMIIKKENAVRLIAALAKGISETEGDYVILEHEDDGLQFLMFNDIGEAMGVK